MKTIILSITLAVLSTGILSQNINGKLGTGGQFMIRDTSTTFLTLPQSTGYLNLNRSLVLPNTTNSTTGVIYKGTSRLLHNYGTSNTFMGINSGNFTMTGSFNSAFGDFSLYGNTTGSQNSAFGSSSLNNNTTGIFNSAFGFYSLRLNTTGDTNSAFGHRSLSVNNSGYSNSAFGYSCLGSNTSGFQNSAFGVRSLHENTTGDFNSAFGYSSLFNNTNGGGNSAFGFQSLYNSTGINCSGFGFASLFSNTTGTNNSAFGVLSGSNITSGSNLTLIGYNSQPTTGTATNQITLGNSSVTSLRCNVTTITSLSDARDKKNIADLSLGIDFLMKLRPRTYNWDKREWYDNNISDGSKMKETPTAGFIAQELDEAQTTAGAEWLNLVLKDNPEKWEATPGNLLPIMVKAIQELKTENEELKQIIIKFQETQNVLAKKIEQIESRDREVKTGEVKKTKFAEEQKEDFQK